MKSSPISSTIAFFRRKWFALRVDNEIFDGIMAHLQKEKDCGYGFSSDREMEAQTEGFSVQEMLDTIERQTREMPTAYAKAFRYILHRDMAKRLRQYADLAERRVNPKSVDMRRVAVRA